MDARTAEHLVNGFEAAIMQAKGLDRAKAENAVRGLIEQLTAATAKGDDIGISTPPTKSARGTSLRLTRLIIEADGTVRAVSPL